MYSEISCKVNMKRVYVLTTREKDISKTAGKDFDWYLKQSKTKTCYWHFLSFQFISIESKRKEVPLQIHPQLKPASLPLVLRRGKVQKNALASRTETQQTKQPYPPENFRARCSDEYTMHPFSMVWAIKLVFHHPTMKQDHRYKVQPSYPFKVPPLLRRKHL